MCEAGIVSGVQKARRSVWNISSSLCSKVALLFGLVLVTDLSQCNATFSFFFFQPKFLGGFLVFLVPGGFLKALGHIICQKIATSKELIHLLVP